MGNPIWQVKSTDLGTIAEEVYFEYSFSAIDTDGDPVTYSLISGEIPAGLTLVDFTLSGIPDNVNVDTSSKFAIRASTTTNNISDVTFSIAVSGQQAPQLITPAGNIGQYYFGSRVHAKIEAIDNDLSDSLTWAVKVGSLPIGITITPDPNNDRIAYLTGYLYPVDLPDNDVKIGFDNNPFDIYSFDFNLSSSDRNYSFGISVSDGKDYDMKMYSIFIYDKNSLTADNCTTVHWSCNHFVNPASADDTIITVDSTITITADNCTTNSDDCLYFSDPITADLTDVFADSEITTADNCTASTVECGVSLDAYTNPLSADQTFPTVDTTVSRNPIITNTNTDLGTVAHDNYYAFQIFGEDFDGDEIRYAEWLDTNVILSQLPPNLEIDPITGWLHGYLTQIGAIEISYTFNVEVYKLNDPSSASSPSEFTIVIVGDVTNTLTWITPDILHIDNGAISELEIIAINTLGLDLTYTRITGDLPIGLELLPSGIIAGRPQFGNNGDNTYTFVVNAQDNTGRTINLNNTFTIIVDQVHIDPYETLYLVAKPTIRERMDFLACANDPKIYNPESIYRRDDPYFDVSFDLRFLLADGLAAKPIADYADAMKNNHYTRSFTYGPLKIAKALNRDKSIRYEVIYAEIMDPLNNTDGVSISTPLVLNNVSPDEIELQGGVPKLDDNGNIIIYPASINNMRDQIFSKITQVTKKTLPGWMTSRQDTGHALGFIPAVVLAYVNPGAGDQLLYNIENSDFDLSLIEFEVDRYVWDNNMTTDPDPIGTGQFYHYSEPIDPELDGSEPTDNDEYENIIGFDMDPYSEGIGIEGPDVDDKFIKFPQDGVFK